VEGRKSQEGGGAGGVRMHADTRAEVPNMASRRDSVPIASYLSPHVASR